MLLVAMFNDVSLEFIHEEEKQVLEPALAKMYI